MLGAEFHKVLEVGGAHHAGSKFFFFLLVS